MTTAFVTPCAGISHPRSAARSRIRSVSLLGALPARTSRVLCTLSGSPPRGGDYAGHGGGGGNGDHFGRGGSDESGRSRSALFALLGAFVAGYARLLSTRPFATKSATTGVLMLLSDYLAQLFTRPALELARLARYLIYGLLIAGPITHLWFSVLERVVRSPGAAGVIQKVILDQCVAAPIFLAIYVLYMHLAEGRRLEGAGPTLRSQHSQALSASIRVWPLVNLFNFSVVPAPHRVAFVAAFNVIWVAYLSISTSSDAETPVVADARPK